MPMKMPMSGAYQRGFKHAVKAAAKIASERGQACETLAQAVANQLEFDSRVRDHFAERERCAAREAGLIAERILKLEPTQLDRQVVVRGRRTGVPT